MPEALRVVARFRDGKTQKGTTQDFKPTSARFHLVPAAGGAPIEVRLAELKAVFFVRSLEGAPGRSKLQGFVEAAAETPQGKKIAVRFEDGELLCGYTMTYSADREGFFVFPADVAGNNVRVYVLTAAAAEIKAGPAAEQLAARVLAKRG